MSTDVLARIHRFIFGDLDKRTRKIYQPFVDKINELEPSIVGLSDDDLKAKTPEFKTRLVNGETLDDILPEAFAVVREASKRTLGMRHFDVQLVGGVVLHQGKISEMKTGEGKTLVSTLPAYLNALEGKGVYLVTVNDYLAKRDSEWMGQIHTFLGLTVGLIQSNMDPETRLQAYQCDITYGTNNEFGFDFLRDNLSYDKNQFCQFRRHYAIIDEVDSILIDEARTPLIISGPVKDNTDRYKKIAIIVAKLQRDHDFTVEEKHKNIILTDSGVDKIESSMNVSNMYSIENMEVAHMAVQCLKASHLFKRDVDYVVKEGEVIIVDEFTGRLMEGRRYSDGLHQAIEAIENLTVRAESQTLASVTFQNYFRLFPKLAGMTGTAKTEESEFISIYGLEVMVVPTNKPVGRNDMVDVIYKSKAEKYKAIVAEVEAANKIGQPVLLGTISIETSELLSEHLKRRNVPHKVLNAKFHEKEADIIANAGQKGSVTIATNMAGRGTDIVLGEGVVELGGLFVVGSSRHESRRIDNQLRGRAGRQGDPGASRFFVSLEDDLMRLFGSDRIVKVMETLGLPEDTPIEHRMISKSIERAQTKVEKYYFGVRKQVLQYDDVLNKQREAVYGLRNQFLELRDLDTRMKLYIKEIVKSHVDTYFMGRPAYEQTEVHADFLKGLQTVFPVQANEINLTKKSSPEELSHTLFVNFSGRYDDKKKGLPEGLFNEIVVKRVFLMILDRNWVEHLHNMDVLREGIGLRSWGQRDPLVEYKREGYDMYQTLIYHVAEEALSMVYRSEIQLEAEATPDNTIIEHAPEKLVYNSEKSTPQVAEPSDKPGRNDACYCGSGKKYKKCHGATAG